MKAILVPQYGGPEQLKLQDLPKPAPGPHQVLIKIAASGVNFIDVYYRTGLYKADLPVSVGMEASGTVEAIGEGVTGFSIGDRVAHAMTRGSYADYQVVPAAQLVAVPPSTDLRLAAAAMLQGMTAHYLTHSSWPLQAGQTALIHAAAGGTGLLLVQIAKLLGARVIGTTSTEDKARHAIAAGADEVILYSKVDFAAEARRLTGGKGVDVVYDSVGQATFAGSLNSLRPRGMLVSFGQSSGPAPAITPLELSQKGSLFLTRPGLPHYIATREELEWRATEVLNWIAASKLKIHVGRVYPLAEAGQAHQDLESRRTMGKLLLVP